MPLTAGPGRTMLCVTTVLQTIDAARSALALDARAGQTVALVPTMGALHDGHLALVQLAHQHADRVAVSIFVNPLQFGPSEDFDAYPRQLEADVQLLEKAGVDWVFAPSVEQMYPNWPTTTMVTAGEAGRILEGEFRPTHFDGVLTVVAKLFSIVQPDIAVFGQKDAQQLALVRRMVADLNLPLQIVAAPIAREPDRLARSSRNAYLSGADRERAVVLSRALAAVAAAAGGGVAAALDAGRAVFASEPTVTVDYLVAVDAATFAPAGPDFRGDALVLTAARVGTTRLIDNCEVRF